MAGTFSMSQSKVLLKSNNSGAPSSNRLISGTSGDDPVWTLSDDEDLATTARKEEEKRAVEQDE